MDRRQFVELGLAASAALAVSPMSLHSSDAKPTLHTLPPLPYPYDALEPYIDAKTMEIHHSKHHQAYVDGLNKAEAELAKARQSGDYALIEYWSKKAAFNGGGHFLHTMFWEIMAPPAKGGGGPVPGRLEAALIDSFGSVEAFRAQMSAAAAAVEGSGWALLHVRPSDGRLIILQAENQHKLTPWGVVPIMGIDVWEHAYYLKYQNRRADYIKAWWNVVNWAKVEDNYLRIVGR
ncbi:MAG: superoxide dismutase [Chlorobiota bacterium]|nr:MAG: superoxide dismutase [Chlorobiota bacterium]